MLTIDNLSKTFGSLKVLSNISVSFDIGDVCGIIGPNGSGKSTLLNCITGIINSYEGFVYSKDYTNYKENLFYLPAEVYFYPRMKGIEFLQYCLKANNLKKDNIHEYNKLFDLPLGRYAEEYSTGMKKKLMFLSMFLLEKPIILLDEPFNGVDIETTNFLLKALKNRESSLIIMVSHDIRHVKKVCNKVIYIKQGEIIKKLGSADFVETVDLGVDESSAEKASFLRSLIKNN
jgi:ABC-2 type transport system ATP-binding protein